MIKCLFCFILFLFQIQVSGASNAKAAVKPKIDTFELSGTCKIQKGHEDCDGTATDSFSVEIANRKAPLKAKLNSCTPTQIEVLKKFYVDKFEVGGTMGEGGLVSISISKCAILRNENRPALAIGEVNHLVDWGRLDKQNGLDPFIIRLSKDLKPIKMEFNEVSFYGSDIKFLCDTDSSKLVSIVLDIHYDAAMATRVYSFKNSDLISKEFSLGCGD